MNPPSAYPLPVGSVRLRISMSHKMAPKAQQTAQKVLYSSFCGHILRRFHQSFQTLGSFNGHSLAAPRVTHEASRLTRMRYPCATHNYHLSIYLSVSKGKRGKRYGKKGLRTATERGFSACFVGVCGF
jgi:hypothetical protein